MLAFIGGNMSGTSFFPALERHDRHVHWANPIAVTLRTVQQPKEFAIREDVPFDNDWFCYYACYEHQHKLGGLQARAYALVTLAEGLVQSVIETTSYLFARVFKRHKCDECWRDVKAQWNGFTLSALAVISPESAKNRFLDYWTDPQNQANFSYLRFYNFEAFVRKA